MIIFTKKDSEGSFIAWFLLLPTQQTVFQDLLNLASIHSKTHKNIWYCHYFFLCFTLNMIDLKEKISIQKKDHFWSLKNYFISCEISIIVFPSPETVGSFPSHFFRYCCTRSLLVNLFSKILLDSASAFALMIFVSASF